MRNVHFRHTARLINALIAAQKNYELLLFPNDAWMSADHGLRGFRRRFWPRVGQVLLNVHVRWTYFNVFQDMLRGEALATESEGPRVHGGTTLRLHPAAQHVVSNEFQGVLLRVLGVHSWNAL